MHSAQRVPGVVGSQGRQLRQISIETVVAGILAALLAVPSGLSYSISVGGFIALVLFPVTFPALWRDRRGRWLIIALLALIPSGWLAAKISLLQDAGRSLNTGFSLYEAAIPVGLLASLVGAYWCTTKLGLQRFLLLSYAGLLAVAPYNPWFIHGAWKYALSLPVSVLVILLLARNRLLLGFVIAPLLVAVSIAGDFRSWIVFLVLSTVVAVYTPARSTKLSPSRLATLSFVTVTSAVSVGWLMVTTATSGMLGDYLEQRTNQQLEFSNGNLLLGGRPEWAAAFALWRKSPLGIGFGVAPSSDDYWLAIRRMPLGTLERQQNSGVATIFRQGAVDFHSTFWTFWGVYGAAGVLFAVLALVYLVHATMGATAAIGSVALRASAILLMFGSIWDILFSPLVIPTLATALATALYVIGGPHVAPIRTKDSLNEKTSAHQRHYNNAQ